MSHTFASLLIHAVFSTKEREKALTPDLRAKVHSYIGGIARENRMKALAIGGTNDHVHVLLSIPTTVAVADAMKAIKAGSSGWISRTFPKQRHFSWQEGYGVFSIGVSQVNETVAYIARQEEHHRAKTFKEEIVAFLERHGIEFVDKDVCD